MENKINAEMMNYKVDGNLNIQKMNEVIGSNSKNLDNNDVYNTSCWSYWQNYYYPQIIRGSYPVYLENRAVDKGKQAFEVIKMLKDKKLIKLETVGEFIEAMDCLIKIL